jgi:hypothetical protein
MRTPAEGNRSYKIFKREPYNTTVCIEVVERPQ